LNERERNARIIPVEQAPDLGRGDRKLEWVVQAQIFMRLSLRKRKNDVLWNWLERGSLLLGLGWLLYQARTAGEALPTPRFDRARGPQRLSVILSALHDHGRLAVFSGSVGGDGRSPQTQAGQTGAGLFAASVTVR
jgi:hypothetical protein